jgi:hypothetical protein
MASHALTENSQAKVMIHYHAPGSTRRLTLGADKGYDTADFVADLRTMCVIPHVAQKVKGSAIDSRTARHPGYDVSQRRHKSGAVRLGQGLWRTCASEVQRRRPPGLLLHLYDGSLRSRAITQTPRDPGRVKIAERTEPPSVRHRTSPQGKIECRFETISTAC